MSELLPCPFCGGAASLYGNEESNQYNVMCHDCESSTAVDHLSRVVRAWNRRAEPENKPPCYFPEKDNPYPLCVGRAMTACAHCCLWADYEPEQDESRVNNPLTPDELSTFEGEPVWIKQGANVYCKVLARFMNPVCYEARRFNFTDGTVLHLVNYNADWLAYRAKPKEERQYSNCSMTGFSTTQEYGVVVSCLTGAGMKRENKPSPHGTAGQIDK